MLILKYKVANERRVELLLLMHKIPKSSYFEQLAYY